MSEQDSPDVNLSNEVQVIREILFGEHFQQIDRRLAILETSLEEIKKENHRLRQALEVETAARQKATRAEGSKLARVRKQIQAQSKTLEDHVNTVLESQGQTQEKYLDKLNRALDKRFERLDGELSDQIAFLQSRHDELINSLATVLSAFQQPILTSKGEKAEPNDARV